MSGVPYNLTLVLPELVFRSGPSWDPEPGTTIDSFDEIVAKWRIAHTSGSSAPAFNVTADVRSVVLTGLLPVSDVLVDGVSLGAPAVASINVEGIVEVATKIPLGGAVSVEMQFSIGPAIESGRQLPGIGVAFSYTTTSGIFPFAMNDTKQSTVISYEMAPPLVSLVLVSDSVTGAASGLAAVGSTVAAEGRVTFAEGVSTDSNLTLTWNKTADLLPQGESLSITAPAALSSSSGSWASIAAGALVDSIAGTAFIDLGTVSNSDADNAVPEVLIVSLNFLVTNGSKGLRNATVLEFDASVQSWFTCEFCVTTESAVHVSSPELELTSLPAPHLAMAEAGMPYNVSFLLRSTSVAQSGAYSIALSDAGLGSAQYDVSHVFIDGACVVDRSGEVAFDASGAPWLAVGAEGVQGFAQAAVLASVPAGGMSQVVLTVQTNPLADTLLPFHVDLTAWAASHPHLAWASNFTTRANASIPGSFALGSLDPFAALDTLSDSQVSVGWDAQVDLPLQFPLGYLAEANLSVQIGENVLATGDVLSSLRLVGVSGGTGVRFGGGLQANLSTFINLSTANTVSGLFEFQFRDIVNDFTAGGSSSGDPLVLRFSGVVRDHPSNVNGSQIRSTARFAAAGITANATLHPIIVLEPLLLDVTVEAVPPLGQSDPASALQGLGSGDSVLFSMQLQHDSASTWPAYGVQVQDSWLHVSHAANVTPSAVSPSSRLLYQLASVVWNGSSAVELPQVTSLLPTNTSLPLDGRASDLSFVYFVAPASEAGASANPATTMNVSYWSHPDPSRGRLYVASPDAGASQSAMTMAVPTATGVVAGDASAGVKSAAPVLAPGTAIVWSARVLLPLSTLADVEFSLDSQAPAGDFFTEFSVAAHTQLSVPFPLATPPSALAALSPPARDSVKVLLPVDRVSGVDAFPGSEWDLVSLIQGASPGTPPVQLIKNTTTIYQPAISWRVGTERANLFPGDPVGTASSGASGTPIALELSMEASATTASSVVRGATVPATFSLKSTSGLFADRVVTLADAVVVEPELSPLVFTPAAVADVEAGDDITFTATLSHAAVSDSVAYHVQLFDQSLVHGKVDYVTAGGEAVSNEVLDARAYDLRRVVVDGSVLFDAATAVDLQGAAASSRSEGLWATLPELRVGTSVDVAITIRLWEGVAAATAVRPQFNCSWVSAPVVNASRAYSAPAPVNPVIGVQAPVVNIQTTTDDSSDADSEAAVGGKITWDVALALPQGVSSGLVAVLNVSAAFPVGMAVPSPTPQLLAEARLESVRIQGGASGAVLVNGTDCAGLPSHARGVLSGPQFPELVSASSVHVRQDAGTVVNTDIVVPLCDVINSDTSSGVSQALLLTFSAFVDGRALPLQDSLRGSRVAALVQVLSDSVPAPTPPENPSAGVISGAAVVPSVANLTARAPEVEVLEPNITIVSVLNSASAAFAGAAIDTTVTASHTSLSDATAYHVRMRDTALTLDAVGQGLYQPVKLVSMGVELLPPAIALAASSLFSSGNGDLVPPGTPLSPTGAPALSRATGSSTLAYRWRLLQGVMPQSTLKPLLQVLYGTHKDPSNPYARHHGPLNLTAAQDAQLQVEQAVEVEVSRVSVSPHPTDSSASASAVSTGFPSSQPVVLGQRIRMEVDASIPLGTVGALVLTAPLHSVPGVVVSPQLVSVAADVSGTDVSEDVTLLGCRSGVLDGVLTSGSLSDLAPAALSQLSNGDLLLDLCTFVSVPSRDSQGLPTGPLASGAPIRLRFIVDARLASLNATSPTIPSLVGGDPVRLSYDRAANGSVLPSMPAPQPVGSIVQGSAPQSLVLTQPRLLNPLMPSPENFSADAADLVTWQLRMSHASLAVAAAPAFNVLVEDATLSQQLYSFVAASVDGVDVSSTVTARGSNAVAFLPTLPFGTTANVSWTVRLLPGVRSSSTFSPALSVSWASHPTASTARFFTSSDLEQMPVGSAPVGGPVPSFVTVPGVALLNMSVASASGRVTSTGAPLTAVGEELQIQVRLALPEGVTGPMRVNVTSSRQGAVFFANSLRVEHVLPAGHSFVPSCAGTSPHSAFVESLSLGPGGRWAVFDTCTISNGDTDNAVTDVLAFRVSAVPTSASDSRAASSLLLLASVRAPEQPLQSSSAPAFVAVAHDLDMDARVNGSAVVSTEQRYTLDAEIVGRGTGFTVNAVNVSVYIVSLGGATELLGSPTVQLNGGTPGVFSRQSLSAAERRDVLTLLREPEGMNAVLDGLGGSGSAALSQRLLQAASGFDVVGSIFPVIQDGDSLSLQHTFAVPRGTQPGTVVNHAVVLSWSGVRSPLLAPGAAQATFVRYAALPVQVTCDSLHTCSGNGRCLPSNSTAASVVGLVAFPEAGLAVDDGKVYAGSSQCVCNDGWMGGACCTCDPLAAEEATCHGHGTCVGYGAGTWGRPRGGQCQCDASHAADGMDPFCKGELCSDSPTLCSASPCASDCLVSAWSNFTADRNSSTGVLTGTMTRTREVLIPPAYGGAACPAFLADSTACDLDECQPRPAAAVADEACKAAETAFRISAAFPAEESSEQTSATVAAAVVAALLALGHLLWMRQADWFDRNTVDQWHTPTMAAVHAHALRFLRVFSHAEVPQAVEELLDRVRGVHQVAPVSDTSDSDSLESGPGHAAVLAHRRASTSSSAHLALSEEDESTQSAVNSNVAALPASAVASMPALTGYTPPQLWANWRNVLLVCLIASDSIMSVAPLFVEQIPWLPYVPVKVLVRLLSLSAIKYIPLYSFFYVVAGLTILGLAIAVPMLSQQRAAALLRMGRRKHKRGSAHSSVAPYPTSHRRSSTASKSSAGTRSVAPTANVSDVSIGTASVASRQHRPGRPQRATLKPLHTQGAKRQPGAGSLAQRVPPVQHGRRQKEDQARAASVVTAESASTAGPKSSKQAPRHARRRLARVRHLANGDALPTAQQETSVVRKIALYRGFVPVALYILGTVGLVPTLVVLMQPFTCGFPFGGYSRDEDGNCLPDPCWGNLHISLMAVSCLLIALLLNLVLVHLPRRMYHDRSLETQYDLASILGHALAKQVFSIHGQQMVPSEEHAQLGSRGFNPRKLSHPRFLAALRRWGHAFEAHPSAVFWCALVSMKVSVAWAGTVLARSSTGAAVLVGACLLTVFAAWSLFRPASTFLMKRLRPLVALSYGAAAVTAWLLVVVWATAPAVSVTFPEQGIEDGSLQDTDASVQSSNFALAETGDMYAAGSTGVIVAAVLWVACAAGCTAWALLGDRKRFAGVPLFRPWAQTVGDGVSSAGTTSALTRTWSSESATTPVATAPPDEVEAQAELSYGAQRSKSHVLDAVSEE